MSLESILRHILDEAEAERNKIIAEAEKRRDAILREAKLEAEGICAEAIEKERASCARQRQKFLANARLESKKCLLQAKQELIDAAFEKLKSKLDKGKIKKQQISADKTHEVPLEIDFYLKSIKADYEAEVAKVLFE